MTTQPPIPKYKQISLDYLRKIISYDPTSGKFTWLETRGKGKAGNEAGTLTPIGYIALEISGARIYGHRLAWFMYHGSWPIGQIDHKNRIKHDNRIINLRDVSQWVNQQNVGLRADNTSGIRGVYFHKHRKKWTLSRRINGKRKCLGYFDLLDDALKAKLNWEEQHNAKL